VTDTMPNSMDPAANPPPAAAEEAGSAAVVAAEPAAELVPTTPPTGVHLGTGRRKSAVARVRMKPGSGIISVNERDIEKFFTEPQDRADVVAPLELTGVRRHWDVSVKVHGGGHTGQAGAIRLGMARMVMKTYPQHEQTLRDAGYLTRDAREVERKKPGQRKARRRFQFSKR
jgi:small subunit ribosomal protein S9